MWPLGQLETKPGNPLESQSWKAKLQVNFIAHCLGSVPILRSQASSFSRRTMWPRGPTCNPSKYVQLHSWQRGFFRGTYFQWQPLHLQVFYSQPTEHKALNFNWYLWSISLIRPVKKGHSFFKIRPSLRFAGGWADISQQPLPEAADSRWTVAPTSLRFTTSTRIVSSRGPGNEIVFNLKVSG